MRKDKKNLFGKLLSAILLLLIGLPLLISMLLSLPPIQNFVVTKAGKIISEKIGTNVSIGYLNMGLLHDVMVNDLLIEDFNHDTLIYVDRLRANISGLKLLTKRIDIEDAIINGGLFSLREMQDSMLNIKQMLNLIQKKDSTSGTDLRIGYIEAHDMRFNYERLEHRNPPYGVDYGDMVMTDIDGKITNFTLKDKIVNLSIDALSGREKSGFEVESFAAKLKIEDGLIDLKEVKASTERSSATMPYITLIGDNWASYKDFIHNVKVESRSVESTLSSYDLAFFAPTFEGVDLVADHLNFTSSGVVDRLAAQIDYMSLGEATELSGSFTSHGLPDFEVATFNVVVDNLTTISNDIELVAKEMFHSTIDPKAVEILQKTGNLTLSGDAQGLLTTMSLDAAIQSTVGEIAYVGDLKDLKIAPQIEGVISTRGLAIGRLIDQPTIGNLTLKSTLSLGVANNKLSRANIDGDIESFQFKGYDYTAIEFDGNLTNDILHSEISSRDKSLNFDLFSIISLDEPQPKYDFTLRLREADLVAMNINHRDSVAKVSLAVKVDASGSNIDNIDGVIDLRNVDYRYDNDTITTPLASLKSRLVNNSMRYITLESDFVDATISSRYDYAELTSYLTNALGSYIPAIYPKGKYNPKDIVESKGHATISVDFKEFTPLSQIIDPDFHVANNSNFRAIFDPHNDDFTLRLLSDFVEFRNFAAFDLNVNGNNKRDSLALYLSSSDLYAGGMHLKNCNVMGGARDNIVDLSAGFRDKEKEASATLGLKAKFHDRNKIDINISPSTISHEGQEWLLDANEVQLDNSRLLIDNFSIKSDNQTLTLNGVASKQLSDSLTLRLRNYDIEMFTPLFSKLGYHISGLTNGYVYLQSVLGDARMRADVKMDSVKVNSLPAPPLQLKAGWDTQLNRAGLNITNRNSCDTLVRGYYIPSDVRYYAKLKSDSIPLSLIDPLLTSVVSDTKGYANTDITFEGDHLNASLNGHIDIFDLKTLIDYTQVSYSVPKGRITVNDNKFECRNANFYDPLGNKGLITMMLSLDHLSNITYRLRIVPKDMMVLNTTLRDNNLFYGNLFASGVATIDGDKKGINMDITATSCDNSKFFMPLTSQTTVMNTDFVTFKQPKKEDDPNELQQRRLNYLRKQKSQGESAAMNINMAIEVSPNAEMQLVIDPTVGDIIKARGDGRLNLRISPKDNIFEMYGDYTVSEGSYLFTLQNLINKRFVVEQGSTINWTGDPMDPLLDIDAIYKLKTPLEPLLNDGTSTRATPVDCIIHLDDRLMQPNVSFGIELPSADTEQQTIVANLLNDQEAISRQFFYLMIANSFISDNVSDIGSSTTAATGFELLTNQLSNWLSSSNYNVIIRYRPESQVAGTSDEIDVGFSKGLIDNRLLIELEGNYITDVQQSNLSNFMGEAYITWLIDKAGALQLKGFTQTIDRFDENQGLQETGIGVYYRESFNNLKDLKKQVIDRFKRKKDE